MRGTTEPSAWQNKVNYSVKPPPHHMAAPIRHGTIVDKNFEKPPLVLSLFSVLICLSLDSLTWVEIYFNLTV